MDRTVPRFAAGVFAFAALSFLIFIVSVEGQTNRRKPAVKPTPTPTPKATEPAVISRADEYPTVVIEPPPSNRTDPNSSVLDPGSAEKIAELRERLARLEQISGKKDPDEKAKRLALNLDILTKSEQRSDSLRKQLFEMIEKENLIRSRIDQIDIDMRPEAIERQLSSVGSLRPEELRAQRRRSLELEKANLQSLLAEVQKNRANIDLNLQRSDALVERLRIKFEKDIDTALSDEPIDKP